MDVADILADTTTDPTKMLNNAFLLAAMAYPRNPEAAKAAMDAAYITRFEYRYEPTGALPDSYVSEYYNRLGGTGTPDLPTMYTFIRNPTVVADLVTPALLASSLTAVKRGGARVTHKKRKAIRA